MNFLIYNYYYYYYTVGALKTQQRRQFTPRDHPYQRAGALS